MRKRGDERVHPSSRSVTALSYDLQNNVLKALANASFLF